LSAWRSPSAWVVGVILLGAILIGRSDAADKPATVVPVFVRLPAAPAGDADGDRPFEAACRRAGLAPVARLDLPPAAPPLAPLALERARTLVGDLRFPEALPELDAAAADANAKGAAGLSGEQLADIYFLRGITRQRVDPTDQRAWDDLVRAATLQPERVLDPGRVAPGAVAAWARAAGVVAQRARGVLTVRAPASAAIVVDARPPVRTPAVIPGLPYGEHLVRVELPGRQPWAAVVPLSAPHLDLEAPELAMASDGEAAELAQRRGAAWVLLAQAKTDADAPALSLRLLDAASRARRAEMTVDLATPDSLDQAVRRLVALAQGRGPTPAAATLASGSATAATSKDAAAIGATGLTVPAATRAPLVRTATVVVVLGALAAGVVAGFLIGHAQGSGGGTAGYSVEIDRTQLGP
jgi:hypothetical protein